MVICLCCVFISWVMMMFSRKVVMFRKMVGSMVLRICCFLILLFSIWCEIWLVWLYMLWLL